MSAERGDMAAAVQLLQQARSADPRHPEVLFRLGLALRSRGDEAAALGCFDELLQVAPGNPAALNARGLSLKALGRNDEALAAFDEAVARAPAFAEALNNRGVLLRALGRHEEALAAFEAAVRARPGASEIHNNLGWTLHLLGRGEEALAACRRALELRPGDPQVLSNVGATLAGLRRNEEAVAAYEKALAADPRAWQTWMNLGAALNELRRGDDALAAFARAEALAPGEPSIAINRGGTLLDIGRPEEALDDFRAAAGAGGAPDAKLEMNLGNAWREMQQPQQAMAHYERALALAPDDADVHFNAALALLADGDYERGWREFEWRFRASRLAHPNVELAAPRWRGEPLAGRTLLLHAEQGLGDTIMLCRYAQLAVQRGARVVLAVQKPLVELLRHSFDGVAHVVAVGGELPQADFWCPLMSAPLAFGTALGAVQGEPYLQADPARVVRWRAEVPQGRLNVGLAWSGNPAFAADRRRSIGLARLLPALPDGPRYWCLQKDVSPQDEQLLAADGRVARFSECGFADTAAQAMLMDVVVASDTSIPHLTAALGRPTWLLLAHSADWRWLVAREDSPWYAGARLLRQAAPGDWDSVLARVAAGLRERMAQA
nr:tetratricopeptide repeat protein [Ramlibacter albus]